MFHASAFRRADASLLAATATTSTKPRRRTASTWCAATNPGPTSPMPILFIDLCAPAARSNPAGLLQFEAGPRIATEEIVRVSDVGDPHVRRVADVLALRAQGHDPQQHHLGELRRVFERGGHL